MRVARLHTTHGGNIGALARRVYACENCGTWHSDKPAQCLRCGLMRFIHFPSRAEAKRYGELRLLQSSGKISGLRCQVPFDLTVRDIKIGRYVADFTYLETGEGGMSGLIVEEVKGNADTVISKWKRKHAEVEHGIKIQVVQR